MGDIVNITYRTIPAQNIPSVGTLVFLCGGPGVPCTDWTPPNVPKNFDYVTFDYVGIGANSQIQKPELMTIENQGHVAAEIIRQLSGRKVLIYCQSYGTTVATVAAAELSQQGTNILSGIVLEGIVGKDLHDYNQVKYGPFEAKTGLGNISARKSVLGIPVSIY